MTTRPPEYEPPSPNAQLAFFYDLAVRTAKQPFEEAVRQDIENAMDAQADRIDIQIEPGKYLRCLDNGIGITREKYAGLNLLGRRNKLPDENTIGKNNSGRFLHLGVAGEMVYRFTSSDFPRVMIHHCTRADLIYLLENMKDKPYPELKKPPTEDTDVPDWCSEHLKGGVGTTVELLGIDNWDQFGTLKGFCTRLRNLLSVWTAERVYVNDKLIPQRPIEDKYDGKISIDQSKYPLLGKECLFYFYRCPKGSTSKDCIRFGKNPICSIESFLQPLSETLLANEVPDWMCGRAVAGFIHLPLVNEFAAHDRNSLQSRFYDNPARAEQVVYFLADEFKPLLLDHYPHLNQGVQKGAVELTSLKKIADLFGPPVHLEGPLGTDLPDRPSGTPIDPIDTPRAKIRISPSGAQLLPGDEQVFEAKIGRKHPRWDAKKCGGTIDAEDGTAIRYVAGDKPGKYKLKYFCDRGTKDIPIEIVASRPFQIIPGWQKRYPGDVAEVDIRNYDGDDAETIITSSEKTRAAQHFVLNRVGNRVRIEIPENCPAGIFTVVANASGGERDTGVIQVEQRPPDEFRQIGDKYYKVLQGLEGSFIDITSLYKNRCIMRVNEDEEFPRLLAQQHGGKNAAYYDSIQMLGILAHIEKFGLENPFATAQEILRDIMKRSEKKK